VNVGNNTWLRQTKIKTYQCPSDPTLGNCLDWCPGDASYAGNFQVFGDPNNRFNWDGGARMPATFQDGTSNTIMFAEKLSRCNGYRGLGGTWWMRGVYHGTRIFNSSHPGPGDSFPADRLSAVFGGGQGTDTIWASGPASKFLVQPANPLATNGGCDRRWSSSGHTAGMNVGLADGSVRFLAQAVSGTTWWAACTPAGGEILGSDW
jgi:hypothetical protein